MRALIENFCVYHVTAPGQEEGAPTLPEEYVHSSLYYRVNALQDCFRYIYPTMDELADQLVQVVRHFNLKQFIGFGVGAGANILCRYALNHPEMVFLAPK